MIFAAGLVFLGGVLVSKIMRPRPQRKLLIIDRLSGPAEPATQSPALPTAVPPTKLWEPLDRITVEQHLLLSTSTLGSAIISTLGVPLLGFFCIFGLLYLNLYFLRRAYVEWQTTGLLGVTDAIVATGLFITRQFGAGALFATIYFVSHKLLLQTQTNLAQQLSHYPQHTKLIESSTADAVDDCAPSTVPPTSSPSQPSWQTVIRQGALPFLTISAITLPFFGAKRALAVLVTNFGYDYRVTAPLSTLTYIELAAQQEIVIADWRAFEQLHAVDVLVLDEQFFAASVIAHKVETASPEQSPNGHILRQLQQDGRRECFIMRTVAAPMLISPTNSVLSDTADPLTNVTTIAKDEAIALIQKLQAAGRTVCLVSCTPLYGGNAPVADVVIVVTAQPTNPASDVRLITEGAHIIVPAGHPEQLLSLCELTDHLAHNLRRGFVIALLPSVFSLSAICFFHFGAFIALLLDSGGLAAGVLNAQWPRLRSRSIPPIGQNDQQY
jgi:hypothetical protein